MDVDRLFDAVYPGLVRFGLRMTGDVHVAEEGARKAFVRFLDQRPRGDTAASRAWLYRALARHLEEVEARNRKAPPRRRLPAHLEGSSGKAMDARDRTLLSALATLPIRERMVLLLREEGLGYPDVAEVAGVPPSGVGGVGNLLVEARRRFVAASRSPEPGSAPS
jgi:DNA-directed RNA polymerase specialized sigma24 family protein